jgi:hypothetical protein
MTRPLATAARRLRHCQLIERGWSIPTLRGFPPPPFKLSPSPLLSPGFERDTRPPPEPYRPRSRSYRLLHDCQYIPDMSVALQILNARRATEPRSKAARPATEAGAGPDALRMALAIGLLMTVAPPVAVTVVWATPTFSRTAQLALTAYGALVTLAMAGVAVAAFL